MPVQRTLFDALQRSQQQLATSHLQLATGKKVQNYADLGTEAVRTLSTRSLLARQDAHESVTKRLETTLAIQDANISNLESAAEKLRVQLLEATGTGQSPNLQASIEEAFQQVRSALNANESGAPLFAGSQTGQLPFKPEKLSDLVGLPVADAFTNDGVRASARVAENHDIEFGILASDLGSKLMAGFRTLAEMGPIGETLSPAQMDPLTVAMKQIEEGLTEVRSLNAENGRKHAQVETLNERAESRAVLLKSVIASNEDADPLEVASELIYRRSVLEASYTTFSQISQLSLLRFI